MIRTTTIARRIIEEDFSGRGQEILMLGLAMAISENKGKKKKEFQNRIKSIMEDMYRRSFLLNYLTSVLPLEIGVGVSFLGDAGEFRSIHEIKDLDGNVNSPPYSTALDYIKNDLEQLAILGLIRTPEELRQLEQRMGGNPRAKYEPSLMMEKIDQNPTDLPGYAIRLIRLMNHYGRQDHAFRLYNFFNLLKDSLAEQFRVLKPGSRMATVIGNNHFKLTDSVDVIKNNTITTKEGEYDVSVHTIINNSRSIDPRPIFGSALLEQYDSTKPIRVSVANNNGNLSHDGVFVEIENERIIHLLGQMVGFKSYLIINRYLEKSQRGNIRYESIVVLEKP